jgi:hypothetical protein
MMIEKSEITKVEPEREQFKTFLLSNPNYFGNLANSPYQAVKQILGNTTYEELTCISFNPNLNTLEATVQIKLPYGYGGNLCQAGSTQYVRFFLNYGSGWEDVGVVAFKAYDIPNSIDCNQQPDKPLSYVVTLPIEPNRKYCGNPVLPLVRGILSWETIPPCDPNWIPVWGNRLEKYIQIKPRQWNFVDLADVISLNVGQKIKLPLQFEEIKLNPIPLPDPPPLALVDVVKMYGGKAKGKQVEAIANISVEPHRFGFNDIQSVLAPGALSQQTISAKISEWQSLGLNWQAAVAALANTNGNVTYEQLDCLGLDYNLERLVATIHIKKPSGYSGNLCQKGSMEYVAFWADWDNTCQWTYLDTVAVNVHDISPMPTDGLHYAAILKVNLDKYRQSCEKPKIARIRAVLSWNALPSKVDPDAIPYWGNRLDSHVLIKPGTPSTGPGAKISILGGIGLADINVFGDGMTKPAAKFALLGINADPWDSSRSCPFGGRVVVQGPPSVGYKYRVWVRETGSGDAVKLIKPIWTVDLNGVGSWHSPDAGSDGFFSYLDNLQNIDDVLAYWDTSGDQAWEIRLEIANPAYIVLGSTPWYKIQLDNTAPEADIHIASGGDCKDFSVGQEINGKFVARDPHFGAFSLSTLPASLSPANPTTGIPPVSSSTTQTSPSPGNDWNLKTNGMKQCGYVVLLQVWDRSILNSSPGSHNYNQDDVGFCLREKANT